MLLSQPSLVRDGPSFTKMAFGVVTVINLLFQFGFVLADAPAIAEAMEVPDRDPT